jgi:hypothetical protein
MGRQHQTTAYCVFFFGIQMQSNGGKESVPVPGSRVQFTSNTISPLQHAGGLLVLPWSSGRGTEAIIRGAEG